MLCIAVCVRIACCYGFIDFVVLFGVCIACDCGVCDIGCVCWYCVVCFRGGLLIVYLALCEAVLGFVVVGLVWFRV